MIYTHFNTPLIYIMV